MSRRARSRVIDTPDPAKVYFHPWVRRGLAAGLDWTASTGSVATLDVLPLPAVPAEARPPVVAVASLKSLFVPVTPA